MGSKNRIAKYILPIMLKEAENENITTWIEPFVGGGNMIDKVPVSFQRIGYDLNNHAIQAMIGIRDYLDSLPNSVSEEYYKSLKGSPPDPITSWIRFVCSFGGKFENGYAREKRSDESTFATYGKNNAIKQNKKLRNYAEESVKNASVQNASVQKIEFKCLSYKDIILDSKSLLYCDPPYEGTTGYKTESFSHPEFWQWCRDISDLGHKVFISEYNAPDDFQCVWQGEIKTNFSSTRNEATHKAIEKLFIYNPCYKLFSEPLDF